MEQISESSVATVFEDMQKSSVSIKISMCLSLVWSILYIYILSVFAETLSWCCVVLIQVGLILASVFSFMKSNQDIKKLVTLKTAKQYDSMNIIERKIFDDKYDKPYTNSITSGVVFAVLSCLFFTLIICARDSLRQAIDVIDASADYIAHNSRVVFVPVLHFMYMIVVTIVWLGAFLCVISLNDIKADPTIP